MDERRATRFELRLPPELGDEIDDWRRRQADLPSRAEAARRLIESGLKNWVKDFKGEPIILVGLVDDETALISTSEGWSEMKLGIWKFLPIWAGPFPPAPSDLIEKVRNQRRDGG